MKSVGKKKEKKKGAFTSTEGQEKIHTGCIQH